MKLIYITRGGVYHVDPATGAETPVTPASLHIWVGPFGLHIFRKPLSIKPDFIRHWRK